MAGPLQIFGDETNRVDNDSIITPFRNIMIGSNESVNFYTLNRAISRLYDVTSIAISASNADYSPFSAIPYATESSLGVVKVAQNSNQDSLDVITSSILSTYLNTDSYPISAASASSTDFNILSGDGKILNRMGFQFGNIPIDASSMTSSTSSVVLTGHISFNTLTTRKFVPNNTYLPTISIQILDSSSDNIKCGYKYTLSNETYTGFDYSIYVYRIISDTETKSNFYLSWMGMGINE